MAHMRSSAHLGRLAALIALAALTGQQPARAELQVLTDASFEGTTQAVTGATTGNWLVTFGKETCDECQELQRVMDELSPDLKEMYTLTARVDVAKNPGLKKRFKIAKVPTTIFFEKGHMFTYPGAPAAEDLQTWVKSPTSERVKVPGEETIVDKIWESITGLFAKPSGAEEL
mmetsp:Transcript_28859/g.65222  ORF Transcript_28859/g.65222 Transcript_28859/m.65222 type:complete len:173 (+) Transcript_28859:94-612(+)